MSENKRDLKAAGKLALAGAAVVFMWPIFLLFLFAPEAVSHLIRKKLGVLNNDEEQTL